MSKRILIILSVLLVGLPFAWAEEGDPPLSPAEVALQAEIQLKQAERFKSICEQIILHGVDPKRAEFIADLNGQTCDQVAAAIANGTNN